MKNLSLLLTLVCLTLQTGFSQTNSTNVKKQYIDTVNSGTTVVVKKDAASDMDVLNSQFNINDVSMGEVIFIKTEDLAPSKPKSERTSFADMANPQATTTVQESTKPARTVATQPVVEKTPVKAATSTRAKAARPQMRSASTSTVKAKKATKAKAKTVAPKAKRAQKYFGSGSARKVKTKKRKLKKRKRVRRSSRNKCFSF